MMEDDGVVRELAAEMLRELGYDVLEAEDGTAALRVLWSGAALAGWQLAPGMAVLGKSFVLDALAERVRALLAG